MRKFILVLLFIFLFFLNIYADKPKYVFLVVCDGMSVSNEIALSNFLYGQGKQNNRRISREIKEYYC